MDQTTYTVPAGFVWPTVGRPGRVPLWALVGDPDQPRQWFDDDELDALANTMKEENDGEQREIVTVSELGKDEQRSLAPVRYKIVSGERRWRAANRAQLPDIEIRVKAYANKGKRMLDMYMLNNNRVPLSDIENARYLAKLMQEHDLGTEEELAALVGKSHPYVSTCLSLLRLVPEVQALMEPSIAERSRLRMGTALVLSRLERSVQANYAERMPKGVGVSTRRQVEWIRAEIARTGQAARTREIKPGTVRKSIEYLSERTTARINEVVAHKAFANLFDKASPQNTEILLGSVKKMLGKVEALLEKMEAQLGRPVSADPPLPKPQAAQDTRAMAAKLAQKRAEPAQTPVPAKAPPPPKPEPPKPAPRPVANLGSSARPTGWPQKGKVVPAPSVLGGTGKEKAVTYMGAMGRYVTDNVSQLKYLELLDKRQFKFQLEGAERPEWMPTREAALEDWDSYCK